MIIGLVGGAVLTQLQEVNNTLILGTLHVVGGVIV